MGYAKRVEIRWRDLDGFGHVNNAVFLTYLEEARDEFYTGLLSHDTVNQMVLRHTSVDFRRSLVQSDDLVDVDAGRDPGRVVERGHPRDDHVERDR